MTAKAGTEINVAPDVGWVISTAEADSVEVAATEVAVGSVPTLDSY
jgi:hypothetical protein